MNKPPENIELWRAITSCKIGKGALDRDGTPLPEYTTATEYALYNLISAVEDIARHLEKVANNE